mgnify:CR=1 FL=1
MVLEREAPPKRDGDGQGLQGAEVGWGRVLVSEVPVDAGSCCCMRHTISVLVENKFGVLTRVAGLFSGRGYNIDTLNVGPTHDPTLSRMTIVTRGDEATVQQICKQLDKLVDVVKVIDFGQSDFVGRELVLVKVAASRQTRAEVAQMAELFRAKIVDVQPASLTIEITGGDQKIEIQPGMTATTEILTGHNTVLKFLLKPLIKTVDQSFGER